MAVEVEQVDFISIPTRDLSRAVAFYRDVLGLPESEYTPAEVETPNVTLSFWNPEKDGGRAGYRGLLEVSKGAKGAKSKVVCDALILDEESRSDTYPYMRIDEDEVDIGHEATVSKIGEEQLFYLMSRGMPEDEAMAMIVRGFIEPIAKELPMEYAIELNRLIELEMEGSVG